MAKFLQRLRTRTSSKDGRLNERLRFHRVSWVHELGRALEDEGYEANLRDWRRQREIVFSFKEGDKTFWNLNFLVEPDGRLAKLSFTKREGDYDTNLLTLASRISKQGQNIYVVEGVLLDELTPSEKDELNSMFGSIRGTVSQVVPTGISGFVHSTGRVTVEPGGQKGQGVYRSLQQEINRLLFLGGFKNADGVKPDIVEQEHTDLVVNITEVASESKSLNWELGIRQTRDVESGRAEVVATIINSGIANLGRYGLGAVVAIKDKQISISVGKYSYNGPFDIIARRRGESLQIGETTEDKQALTEIQERIMEETRHLARNYAHDYNIYAVPTVLALAVSKAFQGLINNALD